MASICLTFFLLFVLMATTWSFNWNENLTPKLKVNYLSQLSDEVYSFLGNQTHKDHFKLLQIDGDSLLIGARNVIYNLSLSDLSENEEQRISWLSPKRDREMCLVKGKSEDECQNYIRVLAKTDSNKLLVCGTNSFNPKCRTYTAESEDLPTNKTTKVTKVNDEEYRMHHEFSGKGYCPHDPRHNSTAIFTGGELYSGTVSDFSGSDALIYKDNLRTEQYDLKHLNSPDFVGSVEDEDHVYFFFRETAVEYINCGKSIYSRVARVCKSDRGGSHKFQHRWTTFLKARLNCSIPGDIPFYFNEIQSSTDFIDVGTKDKIIYGVFTTPENAIAGSAICSFKLSDIKHAFDEGPFKGQATGNSNWLPIRAEDIYSLSAMAGRPGQCTNDSTTLPEISLNFIKQHSLLDETVPNAKLRMTSQELNYDHGEPLFVKTSLNERLTVIAVDPQIRTPSGTFFDVLYTGTTKGKVFKVVSVFEEKDNNGKKHIKRKPVIIEDIQVFPYHVPIRNLHVLNQSKNKSQRLVVLSDFEVKSIPLHRCSVVQVQSCSGCVALQDPHCAWNLQTGKCVDHTTFESTDASVLIQDVFNGKHPVCANEPEMVRTTNQLQTVAAPQNRVADLFSAEEPASQPTKMIDVMVNIEENREIEIPDYDLPVQQEPDVMYGGSTFIAAVIVTALICLILGFGSGWFASRKWAKDDYRSCGHRYLEEQHSKNHENAALNRPADSTTHYSTAPCNNLTTPNIVETPNRNNLLVHLNKTLTKTTTELNEKNNLNNTVITPADIDLVTELTPVKTTDTTIQYNGTIPRNTGTLCKKVYI